MSERERTVEELIENSIDRTEMTESEHIAFVNYWFDKYEQGGFADKFTSPFDLYEEQAKHKDQPFSVIGRCPVGCCDLECLPMWKIKFADGYEMSAYPEEICKLELDEEE